MGSAELGPVVFGHLGADADEKAAVLLWVNFGGKGVFGYGFVYAMRAGRPTPIATFKGGDRRDGGIVSVAIEKRMLVVVREYGRYMCCPEYEVTTTYRLENATLRPIATKRRSVTR